ncbi:phytanoyl-CoA dioxygenase family protein [Dongia rigui]|uniref:Phytanoyl-CoA dioxygenase family protein n=1 Tax=Dongia rigui TaxID=940149 RepID=A0ABU5DTH1_9PROT|nr:phytanoyl-CoA dioxygenase family protein [Dongia rigui]MDY0870612.1 phytanoyl-CoA dioxygenase family protein [Dongia rigui]
MSTDTTPRRFAATDTGLTPDMRAAFEADGYLLIENFVPTELCDGLVARANELVAGFDAEAHRTVFSTKSVAHAADRYFRESGDAIRFFLEEEAVDADGHLTRPKALAVNKLGHAMHDLDPAFSAFSRQPRLASLAKGLLSDPLLLQSMYIFKQPGIGGEVSWHQDSTYLYTEPMSCIGFWFALEDADSTNGGMLGMPGAHKGPLRKRFRHVDGDQLVTETLDPAPWPDRPAVNLDAKKGSLIVLHGLLPHYSSANRSTRSRHAYTLHCIDGAARYPADNWLRRGPDLPLRGF